MTPYVAFSPSGPASLTRAQRVSPVGRGSFVHRMSRKDLGDAGQPARLQSKLSAPMNAMPEVEQAMARNERVQQLMVPLLTTTAFGESTRGRCIGSSVHVIG